MNTFFETLTPGKKTMKLNKRRLSLETLESRELLSVNPLGYDAPDDNGIVQAPASPVAAAVVAKADVVTEAAGDITIDTTVTTKGVTSSAVTFDWTAIKKIKVEGAASAITEFNFTGAKYTLTLTDKAGSNPQVVAPITGTTKVTAAFTGLTSTAGYDWKLEVTGSYKDADGASQTVAATQVTTGTVTLAQKVDGDDAAVGVVTDVKTSQVRGTATKPASVKVTWKAPANYTGDYVVTFTQLGTDGTATTTTKTATVTPGKTEAIIADADLVAENTTYAVTVKPAMTNAIDAVPTYYVKGATVDGKIRPSKTNTAAVESAAVKPPAKDSVSGTVVKWKAPTGTTAENAPAKYLVTVVDANKAIIYQETTADATVLSFDFAALVAAKKITPGAKYTVEVRSIVVEAAPPSGGGDDTGTSTEAAGDLTYSKALSIASVAPLAAYEGSKVALKADNSNKATTTTVNLLLDKALSSGGNYTVYYTSTVDAKGKPDWDTAKALAVTDATKTIAVTGLLPSTQYFFRVVTADAADAADVTLAATSKEVKVKTAAVPLPTISKTGFQLNAASEFCLGVSGKGINQAAHQQAKGDAAKAEALTGTIGTSTYTWVVSTDTKTDKATGKLIGGMEVTDGTNPIELAAAEPAIAAGTKNDYKGDNITANVSFASVFKTLAKNNTNYPTVKSLSVQLQVVTKIDGVDVTLYSKAVKVTLPKWL